MTTTITRRQFNQDAGGAKKAADTGPVIITDRGRPAHVLLRFEDYQKLLRKNQACLTLWCKRRRQSPSLRRPIRSVAPE